MEKIHCTAPIGLAELKRKFTEDVEFVIDYDNSRFKGKTLITYLSNLDIQVRLDLKDPVAIQELLADYFNMSALVKIADLEELAMNVLLAFSEKPYVLPFDVVPFIQANFDILSVWTRRLQSLPLYAIHTMGEKYHEYVFSFPEDTDDSVVGLNFVNLIKLPMFAVLIAGVSEEAYTWNKTFFTDYVFGGNNLFNYFAVKENPLFIGVLALQDQTSFDSVVPQLLEAEADADRHIKELQHVPSV